MNYRQALRFPFHGPKPWANIGLIALCNLIPIVGPLVVLGYSVLVEKALIRDLDAAPPTFDFNQFSKYLERGVAPFVVSLIAAVIMVPLVWAIMIAFIMSMALLQKTPWLFALAIAIGAICWILLVLSMNLIMLPLVLRASLLGKIGLAFDFKWCLDFIKRTLWSTLAAYFVMALISIPIALAGMCTLYVGIFFAAAIITLLQRHIQIQLYHLYLDRGGSPLPIADEPLLPAFPVIAPTNTPANQPDR